MKNIKRGTIHLKTSKLYGILNRTVIELQVNEKPYSMGIVDNFFYENPKQRGTTLTDAIVKKIKEMTTQYGINSIKLQYGILHVDPENIKEGLFPQAGNPVH